MSESQITKVENGVAKIGITPSHLVALGAGAAVGAFVSHITRPSTAATTKKKKQLGSIGDTNGYYDKNGNYVSTTNGYLNISDGSLNRSFVTITKMKPGVTGKSQDINYFADSNTNLPVSVTFNINYDITYQGETNTVLIGDDVYLFPLAFWYLYKNNYANLNVIIHFNPNYDLNGIYILMNDEYTKLLNK